MRRAARVRLDGVADVAGRRALDPLHAMAARHRSKLVRDFGDLGVEERGQPLRELPSADDRPISVLSLAERG